MYVLINFTRRYLKVYALMHAVCTCTFTVTVKPYSKRSYRSKIPVAVLVSTQLALFVDLNGVTAQVLVVFVPVRTP